MVANEQFEAGAILYFDPFIFQDGGTPKRKYFVVLKRNDTEIILASLPTSKDSVPATITKEHGCIERPDIDFNCYYFEGGKPVCVNGFAFPTDTYIYGFRIKLFDINQFQTQQSEHQTIVTIKGQLTDTEYKQLIKCLLHSTSVKRKYRHMLSEIHL